MAIGTRFSTTDVDLASFVVSQLSAIPTIERTDPQSPATFIFDHADASHVATKFSDSESAAFAFARRQLLWRLHRTSVSPRLAGRGGDPR